MEWIIIGKTQTKVIENINQADINNGLVFGKNFLLSQLNYVDSRLDSISCKNTNNNINDNGRGMKENNIENDIDHW